ncbi:hypothetical protein Bca101_090076 [Brassica carinata]
MRSVPGGTYLVLQSGLVRKRITLPDTSLEYIPTNMQHLTEVVIEDGAMVGIQKLYVRACRVLESLPRGIENLVNLQELHLSHVSDQLVERIRGEEGVDRWSVKHIPAIKHHFRTEDGSFYVSLSS